MIEIINNQRKIKLDWKSFQTFSESLSAVITETGKKSFTIAFVSDRKMRELNKQFRGKNSTTDVLSFPFERDEFDTDENNLGEIIISTEQAERQVNDNHLSLELGNQTIDSARRFASLRI